MPRKSARAQKATAASVVTDEMRAMAALARLDALNRDDGGAADAEAEAEGSDDEYVFEGEEVDEDGDLVEKSSRKKGKAKARGGAKGRGKKAVAAGVGPRRTKKTRAARGAAASAAARAGLASLLEEAPEAARRAYLFASATPSTYPSRRFCDLSGNEAKYVDPNTRMRYAGRKEFRMIQEMPALAVQARTLRNVR